MVFSKMNEEINKNVLKTGTSLVGIVCRDGVVMASDRQVTGGQIVVMSKDEQKTLQVNDYTLVAFAGVASEGTMLKKVLGAELKLKSLRSKRRPTIKEVANLAATIVYRNIRQPSMVTPIVGTMVGGFDEDGTTSFYSIDVAGHVKKISDYDASISSGMPYILGVLERNYHESMTVKEGVELAIESIKASTQRDIGSGFGIDVFTITKDGIKHVVKQKIEPSFKEEREKVKTIKK